MTKHPEFLFAIVASYLTPEEGRELRKYTGSVTYRYSKNGNTYKNGVLHSFEDNPATETPICKTWYKDGMRHREGDLPAVIYNTNEGHKEWCKNGLLHRDGDLPAVERGNYKAWYKNGLLHREGDLPAVVDSDRQIWCVNGVVHREGDLPAKIGRNIQLWYKQGKHHRENGLPAVVTPDFSVWFLYDYVYWESHKCLCLNSLTLAIHILRRLFISFD